MIFDPEMAAGLKRLSELKPEDLTPEQREAVSNAIAKIDIFRASVAEAMKEPEYEIQYTPYGVTRVRK